MESSTPRLLLRYIRRNMLKKVVNEVKATTFRYYSTKTIHYTVQYQYISGSGYGGRQPEQAARE